MKDVIVELSRADGVAVLTLKSPPVNALSASLVCALHAALDSVEGDGDTCVLLVRSALKVFCAGADLAEMRANLARPDLIDKQIASVREMQRILKRLEFLPLTTVSEIGGAAVGGGLELALACDFRVAASEAKLGLPECGLGLIPGAGGTQRLTALCGAAISKRLILGAEVLDGATAVALGLAHWSKPRVELAGFVADLTGRLAKIPRAAAAAAKSCIAAYFDPARNGYEEELERTRELLLDEPARARVDAFLSQNR
jgi:enoyl-CoA hydratase/carnithine racemase